MPRWGFARVRGRSMEPTLYDGDRLLVRYGVSPQIDQLAVVRLAHRPLAVKRVTFHVDDGWWVERDNPLVGDDSWRLGAVGDDDVVAVVVRRVWPLRRD